jgi:hypothetical protein
MDEPAARRVILAEAIETTDGEGRLLAPSERDQVDAQARQDALHRHGGRGPMPVEEFIHLRAQRVLGAVGAHHPRIAALQEPPVGWQWLEWLVPLAAFVTGVATDAIGNPHRVDLVSLPLLGIVVWNVVVYLLLIASALRPARPGRPPWLASVGRWTDGERPWRRRAGNAAALATTRFHVRWFEATQALHVQRIKRVLHLAAAAWALGIILSLIVRGLVVEYRVGWESTFLGPAQVHAILSVLRLPALLVFPFATFTVQDVAQLRFSEGGGAAAGAPWVWMYVALLLTAVILPRLSLATFAAWREGRLARAVPLDLGSAYYQRIASLLSSTRVQLGLIAHRAQDRERLLRVIAPDRESLPILVSSPLGDVMRLLDIPLLAPPADAPAATRSNWLARLRGVLSPRAPGSHGGVEPVLAHARDECDVVVHALGRDGDAQAAQPLLQWLARPVLHVGMADGFAQGLRFGDFACSWVQDRVFLDAVARVLPADRTHGFDRIVRAWEARNDERLHRSMMALADHLLFAARQVEEVQAGTVTVRNILPAERQVQSNARQAAVEGIVQKLDASAAAMTARLREIHHVDEIAGAALEQRLEERFVVQQPVHAQQAGVAGAATGAAMGASVDLLAGGLTLGAAAALGALVGGGAAYVAAAWRNRASPTGATIVQLSEDMLEALAEAALLRYLAVVHWARGYPDVDPEWRTQVASGVQAQKVLFPGYWTGARTQPNPSRLVQPLAHELEGIARGVLKRLYPAR